MTDQHRMPIWAAFAMALIMIVVVGMASYWSAHRFERDSEWVAHTRTVISDLQGLLEAVVDAEDASRNYILFGDSAYNDEVGKARAAAQATLGQLRELVSDNPAQVRRLDPLGRLVAARFAVLVHTVKTWEAAGRDAAVGNAVSNRTAQMMAQIRAAIGAMLKSEDELLLARRAAEYSAARWTQRVIIGGMAAACILVFFGGIHIERALAELRAATARATEAAAEASEQHRIVQIQNQILEQQRVRSRQMFEQTPDALLITTTGGEVLYANALAGRLFGYAPTELMGARVQMLLPERVRAGGYFDGPDAGWLRDGLELYARRSDGSEFPAEVRLSMVDSDIGPVVMAVVRDLTDWRQAERNRALLAALVEASQYALVSMSADGVVLTWNPGAERVYGYRANEMVGQPVEILLPSDQRRGWRERLSEVVHGSGAVEFEDQRLRRDGALIDVAIAASPIRNSGSVGYALATISYDITERKRAERVLAARSAELTRSNAELEQFAYVTSHDLQEPLRMVASYLQLIRQRYSGKLDRDADEFINFAVDGAVRMKLLINDLLEYSRAGRPCAVGEVDLEAVLNRALSALSVAIAESGAKVTHAPLPAVLGDESGMYEVLQNLVGNAIKFRGGEPARIHIAARRDGGEWVISVRDRGIGIAPEHRERIFAMFQRLHGRDEYPGTGIGLAICKRIVERLGGRIWVESDPGQGATFLFTVPAVDPQEVIENVARHG